MKSTKIVIRGHPPRGAAASVWCCTYSHNPNSTPPTDQSVWISSPRPSHSPTEHKSRRGFEGNQRSLESHQLRLAAKNLIYYFYCVLVSYHESYKSYKRLAGLVFYRTYESYKSYKSLAGLTLHSILPHVRITQTNHTKPSPGSPP